jgi:primosomal protein N'
MLINANLNEEALKNDCERITSLYKKITELDMEISKIEEEILKRRYGENVVLCPKCTTVNKSDDKFCKSCGTNLQEEVAAEQYKCSVCGATLKKSEKFCQRCGKKRGD